MIRPALLTATMTTALGLFELSALAQEAPRSFDEQIGFLSDERFEAAREAFEEIETPESGLGVHFNARSCAECHLPPGDGRLPGGSGPITELRAGFNAANERFVAAPGGTLITTSATAGATPEIRLLADGHDVRDRFLTPSLFGAGLVEAVADDDLRRVARDQERRTRGRIQGLVREVPILEAPGQTAVGRFGWAAQHASLLSFSADAYRNEMGITSPLQPDDHTLLGNPVDDGVADPEDTGGAFGEDVELFADFMRALSAPPRLASEDDREIRSGLRVFESIGCDTCHVPELRTAGTGTLLHGGTFRVPRALGRKRFHPYADFLLHDIGTGPDILREGLPAEARHRVRTAALWGLGTRVANDEALLHDGSAQTIVDAIMRHGNSAAREAEAFEGLAEEDRANLLLFLESL
jgi:CxxC motif-containing protein (DUF1111 family)